MRWRSAMLLAPVSLAVLALPLASACSLLTSFDGLAGGAPIAGDGGAEAMAEAGDASTEAAADARVEASADAAGDASGPGCSDPALVGRWSFEEGSGAVAHDCSGNAIAGIFSGNVGALGWGTRAGGHCLEINGAGGYLSMGMPTKLAVTDAFSVAAWVRNDAAVTNGYLGIAWDFTGAGFELTQDSTGTLYTQLGFSDATAGKMFFPSLFTATWTHLAVVFVRGVRLEIYVNGVSAKIRTTADGLSLAGLAPSMADFRIGLLDASTTWTGGIDEVQVYSRALTNAEIAVLASP